MSKKINRVKVILDSGDIEDLPENDIKMILRAADELIFSGGRTMLAKILKGSKEKKIFELKLNECPSYGFYNELKIDDINNRIDWMIENDYLKIEYNYKLPLLIFSDKGWEIEKETYAEELYQKFCLDIKENNIRIIYNMSKVNRKVVMLILDKIEKEGTKEFIPLLEAWKALEVKKVRSRINEVEKTIENK